MFQSTLTLFFGLKGLNSFTLCSNNLCKFACSSDVNVTYIGTSSRQFSVRDMEHVNFTSSNNSSIKDHSKLYEKCLNK